MNLGAVFPPAEVAALAAADQVVSECESLQIRVGKVRRLHATITLPPPVPTSPAQRLCRVCRTVAPCETIRLLDRPVA